MSIPPLEFAAHLQLPPVATYSDIILYKWALKSPTDETTPPALDNLRSQDLFTGTNNEQEFYLASSRIQIRGVEALEFMYTTMDKTFVGDEIAVRWITGCLHQLASVVVDPTNILLNVRKGCDPELFYHSIRPWFCGEDSDPTHRKGLFEGLDERPEIDPPTQRNSTWRAGMHCGIRRFRTPAIRTSTIETLAIRTLSIRTPTIKTLGIRTLTIRR